MSVTREDIDRLLAAPPPRPVPGHVAQAGLGRLAWIVPGAWIFLGLAGLQVLQSFRREESGWWTAALPLVALGLLYCARRITAARRRLLTHGHVAKVRMHRITRRSTHGGNRRNRLYPVFDVVLYSPVPGVTDWIEIVVTDLKEASLAGQAVAQNEPIAVIYDPAQPTRLLLPDALIDYAEPLPPPPGGEPDYGHLS